MPELPEVQRAVKLLQLVARGKRISSVETFPDSIVFAGTTDHGDFVTELQNRVVLDAKRYGKVFYLCLDGDGKHPVLHFGMTGNLQVKGVGGSKDWPPRFCKFIFHLQDTSNPPNESETQLAFCDARRLARIRLCSEPTTEPPISELGFDPLLSMPTLDVFSKRVVKRSCPVKALLLDQSFSAGVGNWIADEVLYNARIHPEQRCNTLTPEQIQQLYTNVVYVCQTAVDVNADHRLFPKDWLFTHRWGKGKKTLARAPLLLPSGSKGTIKWIKVGGRTSAYVTELQKLPRNQPLPAGTSSQSDKESELRPLTESEEESKPKPNVAKKRKVLHTDVDPPPTETTHGKPNPTRSQPSRSSKRLQSQPDKNLTSKGPR